MNEINQVKMTMKNDGDKSTISEMQIVNCSHAFMFFTETDHKRFKRVITIES